MRTHIVECNDACGVEIRAPAAAASGLPRSTGDYARAPEA